MNCTLRDLIDVEAQLHQSTIPNSVLYQMDPKMLDDTLPLAGEMRWQGIFDRHLNHDAIYHWRKYVRQEGLTQDKLWTLNDVRVQVPAMRPYFNNNEEKLAFAQWRGCGKSPPCWDIVVRCEIDIIVEHRWDVSEIAEVEIPFWHNAWYFIDRLPFPASIADDYQDIWDAIEIEVKEDDNIQDLIIDRRRDSEVAETEGIDQ